MVLLDSDMVATDAGCCCGGGACCTDGVCSILSESNCTDGGGNYLGDGSTCDGVDCTQGACCDSDDGSCFLDTSECADYGPPYSYQGDGTVCDPNPCPQPPQTCAGCAFPEFIPSTPPVYYLVKTYVYSRTASRVLPSSPPCTLSANSTTTKTITITEDSCTMETECSGSETVHIDGEDDCTATWTNSATHQHDDDSGFDSGCEWSPTCLNCVGGTCDGTGGSTTTTATTQTRTCSVVTPTASAADTMTVTLSSPCSDPMGSVFSGPFFQNN